MRFNIRQIVLCLGFFVTMTACALPDRRLHTYADYLKEAVGHADHDVVAKKMGAPNRIVALDKGGDLWTYEFCQRSTIDSLNTPSSTGTVSYPPGYCKKLDLVFDNSGKLAEWHDK
jgi:hypothetical protein